MGNTTSEVGSTSRICLEMVLMLFRRIGEDAMFYLLTETSIFVSLPNDCLCQITGDPILHMQSPVPTTTVPGAGNNYPPASPRGVKRRLVSEHGKGRSTKRQKRDDAPNVDTSGNARGDSAERCAFADRTSVDNHALT